MNMIPQVDNEFEEYEGQKKTNKQYIRSWNLHLEPNLVIALSITFMISFEDLI